MLNRISPHGDYDHIGSAKTLIKNFKVSNIIMNNGNNNELESKIIKLLKLKNINVKNISKKKINISGNIFYFLNNINIEENKDSKFSIQS